MPSTDNPNLARRKFLSMSATAAGSFLAPRLAFGTGSRRIKAVLFDAFPIFDPRSILALAEELVPGRGNELASLWRDRQFEYCWLRIVSGQYEDFWQVTESALQFAITSLKLELTADKRTRLMNAYLEKKPWPDVIPALRSLKDSGLRLAFLSNFTRKMLDSCIQSSGLQGLFDHVLSTDVVKSYKPDRRAYQMGLDAFGLPRDQIAFAAFAGWDVAGAKWFGYPTFWVNRLEQVPEMGVAPDDESKDLSGLLRFVRS